MPLQADRTSPTTLTVTRRFAADPGRVHAQRRGGLAPEREHIHIASHGDEVRGADRQPCGERGDGVPLRARDGTHHPPERVANGVRRRAGERDHDRRIGERTDDDARHEQDAGIGAAASRPGHEQHGGDRA